VRGLPRSIRGFPASPAIARARFEALLAMLSDNKKRTIRSSGPWTPTTSVSTGATDFSNLVNIGLVRVTMPLPPNVSLIDPATCATPNPVLCQATDETSVDLWRAVMPVNNVAITGPDAVPPIWPTFRNVARRPAFPQPAADPVVERSRCRSRLRDGGRARGTLGVLAKALSAERSDRKFATPSPAC
jgi:hypothetical protein